MKIFTSNKTSSYNKGQNKKINKSSSHFQESLNNSIKNTNITDLVSNEGMSIDALHQINTINPFFMLHEFKEIEQEQKLFIDSTKQILELLSKIRLGIVEGEFTYSHLQTLQHTLKSVPTYFSDPKMTAIINEIILRAEVELAKLQNSSLI